MTITQRQMNKKERRFLARERVFRPSLAEMLGIALLPSLVLAMIGSAIWLLIARVSGLLPCCVQWSDVPIVFWGVVTISLLITVYCVGGMIRQFRKDSKRSKSRQDLIAADDAAGMVEEERVTISGVKVFREPEHFMKIYFLLFSDNRILVRYDYESANIDGDDKSKRSNFPLHQDLTMVRFPQSGLLKYDFSGPVIRKPRAIPLTLHAKKWPDDETWCDIPWDDLASAMSAPL